MKSTTIEILSAVDVSFMVWLVDDIAYRSECVRCDDDDDNRLCVGSPIGRDSEQQIPPLATQWVSGLYRVEEAKKNSNNSCAYIRTIGTCIVF